MKGLQCLWLLIATLASCGCRDINFSMEGYHKAVLSGLDQIPQARQFDELFGKENVDHFIGYSGDRNDCDWNSEVYFAGRYCLTMRVPVRMGRSFDEVLEVRGEPKFYMVEITEVDDSDGQIGAFMRSNFQSQYGRFGSEKWDKLYQAQGDFSAVGIPIKRDEPVDRFDDLVAAVRRDRVQVDR
jgi:hypothetical protein